MKNLNEMKVSELKEMAKEMKISNWWNLKKEVLIAKIEEVQNMTNEEKQIIEDQKAKEDAAIAEYTKNWRKYTERYNVEEFFMKWKSGEIVLESEQVEETKGEEIPTNTLIETPAPEEKPVANLVEDKEPVEEIEPFVYTDVFGERWEDYDIGEKIHKWSEEKKAEFNEWSSKYVSDPEVDLDALGDAIDTWSNNWDVKHNAEKKEGHKPTPKRGALIEWNGKAQNICKWGEELGISPNTLYGRLYKMNWSVEKAFTTPARKSK